MLPQPLLIFPCNGNGREAADCLGEDYVLIGFIDDEPAKLELSRQVAPVFGREALQRWPEARVLAVPGSPQSYVSRREVIDRLRVDPERFARVVHPHASISPNASVGRNVLVMSGVVITSNARIGDHVCILPNSVVHHDVAVGDWTLVGSNVTIAGRVRISENCYIGSGTSIRDGTAVGQGALIGLGSNVVRDVPPGAHVAGNPARAL